MENEWYEMNFSKFADKSYGSDTMYQQYNCPTSSYQQYNCLPNQYQPILNQGCCLHRYILCRQQPPCPKNLLVIQL